MRKARASDNRRRFFVPGSCQRETSRRQIGAVLKKPLQPALEARHALEHFLFEYFDREQRNQSHHRAQPQREVLPSGRLSTV